MISLFTLKKLALFIAVSIVIFVNLAISVARFTGYSSFMGDFTLNVYVTSMSKSASSTTVMIKLAGKSGIEAKNAYFSQAALMMKIGNKSLGVQQFQTNGIVGEFDGKTFVATSDFTFTGDRMMAIDEFPGKPLDYRVFLTTHFITGDHNTRGTMFFEGQIKKVGE